MGLISGSKIRKLLEDEGAEPNTRLVITPVFDPARQIQDGAASIDLRLGSRFSATKRRRLSLLETGRPGAHPRTMVDEYYVPLGERFILHPRHFVLATTLEWIRLPPTLGGYIMGRSSFGRRGLIIATAAGVHPGYSGVLTLELTNVAEVPISIVPGDAICQLFLHDVVDWDPKKVDKSTYLGSLMPALGEPRPDDITEFLWRLDLDATNEDPE